MCAAGCKNSYPVQDQEILIWDPVSDTLFQIE